MSSFIAYYFEAEVERGICFDQYSMCLTNTLLLRSPQIFNMHEVDNPDNCCSFLKESATSMNVYIRKSVALVLVLSQEASNYLYHQW